MAGPALLAAGQAGIQSRVVHLSLRVHGTAELGSEHLSSVNFVCLRKKHVQGAMDVEMGSQKGHGFGQVFMP